MMKSIPGLLALMLLASCAPKGPAHQLALYQRYDLPAKLPQKPENVVVKVSLSAQRVYVMEGEKLLMAMPVSVGKPSSPTPKGDFRIFRKVAKHRANSHGFVHQGGHVRRGYLRDRPGGWSFTGTPMPYWCEFKAHYGFHTGWMKRQPCTMGCIRMHENLAPKFFRLVSVGTPVRIAASQPEDRRYAEIPEPPDAGPLPDYGTSMYMSDGYFSRHLPARFD